jgi:hypothetical protein
MLFFGKTKTYLYCYYQNPTYDLKTFAVEAKNQEKADIKARKRFDELWAEGLTANAVYFREADKWKHQLPSAA